MTAGEGCVSAKRALPGARVIRRFLHERQGFTDFGSFLEAVGNAQLALSLPRPVAPGVDAELAGYINNPGMPGFRRTVQSLASGSSSQKAKEAGFFVSFDALEREVEVEAGLPSLAFGHPGAQILVDPAFYGQGLFTIPSFDFGKLLIQVIVQQVAGDLRQIRGALNPESLVFWIRQRIKGPSRPVK